ncbi:MAG: amidohydrolase family protein [Pirellulaceae bacterium]
MIDVRQPVAQRAIQHTRWLSGLLCLWATCGLVQAAGPLAIQGAKIITISGDTIESGTILIRDGKIEAVGTDVKIPGEAKVIDAKGKVVMPGFVDAHNSAAMSQANERTEVVPFLSVVDSIDPVADYFEECRRNGITAAAVVPGNSTLIGGQAAVLKTAGQYVNDMLLVREAGLKLSLRPTSGSRMSQMARLRKELDKAKEAIKKAGKEEKEKPKDDAPEAKPEGKPEEAPQESNGEGAENGNGNANTASNAAAEEVGLKALMKAVQGESPVYIYCENGMDVVAAIKLVEDYHLKPIYVLGQNCYKAVEILSGQRKTVILDPTLVYWETNPRTREDKQIVLPQIYRDAGVPYIFQTDDSGSRRTLGSSYFWYQAAMAVRYGMSEADALKAITLDPAKLVGIDHLVGSIEVGKDADLLILTGGPFDIGTWVEHTLVDGEVVYSRAEDEKLQRLLAPTAE